MKNIVKHLYPILHAVILAGILLLLIGLYYGVIKAGIPYQDPPLELQIEYEIHARIGDLLMADGFKMILCGGLIRLLLGQIYKKTQ